MVLQLLHREKKAMQQSRKLGAQGRYCTRNAGTAPVPVVRNAVLQQCQWCATRYCNSGAQRGTAFEIFVVFSRFIFTYKYYICYSKKLRKLTARSASTRVVCVTVETVFI
jgi:hypothetical protein